MTHEKIIVHIDDESLLELSPIYLTNHRDELPVLRDAVAKGDLTPYSALGAK